YKCICVMPDKMSDEKIKLLEAYGAKVVITPTAVEPDDPRSYYSVSKRIAKETPNSFYANQYHNEINPLAHYKTTGPEIWEQTNGKVGLLVAGMGTGGTISGTGKFLKEQNNLIKVIGVDPIGSILYEQFKSGKAASRPKTYKIEGIGEDFLPTTLDFNILDDIVQVSDKESFCITRRLCREEGIFAGGSSGSAVAGTLKYLKENNLENKLAVVILPDSGSRYLSKIFNNDWMQKNGMLDCSEQDKVGELLKLKASNDVIAVGRMDTIESVISRMKEGNVSQFPVVDDGKVIGMVSETDLLNYVVSDRRNISKPVGTVVNVNVAIVNSEANLNDLYETILKDSAVLVVDKEKIRGIITKIDLLDFMWRKSK
ncbi:pyridoxal-phosphate dependent enzyme, partial [Candidatus Woesearchaeota archaeon]|nr:pyridoxal-phosphate dependent enzyme [Candidatus Woesearchaeota archaeon]